ncbi:MAG: hypothetical protein KJ061_11570, partial [Vicinamibacteraceae bacterium]|nr:hypothetical protein [Vicinamibacteraceae bacterium]
AAAKDEPVDEPAPRTVLSQHADPPSGARMPRIPLRDVTPGQRLARPITNARGVVLVQAGTELTPSLVARLESMGVDGVFVPGPGTEDALKPLDEALAEIDARFSGHEGDAWMMDLLELVKAQLRERYAAHG